MASAPRYVLSERAANALRALIAPGSVYGARPRIAHDPGATPAPALLAVRRVRQWQEPAAGEEEGEWVERLQIYLGPAGEPAATCIRINGRAAPLDWSGTLTDGWLDLGPSAGVQAVWLLPYIANPANPDDFAGATNQPPPVQVRLELAARGTPSQPPKPTTPGPATGTALLQRFLKPILVWTPDAQVQWGGATIAAEVADADGTHDGVHEGFCSIEQLQGGRLQLYGFNSPTWTTAQDLDVADGGFLIREGPTPQSGGPARLVYASWQELREYLKQYCGFDLLEWLSDPGNLDTLIGILSDAMNAAGLYWPQGGSYTTCYGSYIGDYSKTAVIYQDGKTLMGAWKTDSNFSVGDQSHAANLTVNGDATVAGAASVSGAATVGGSADVTGNLAVHGIQSTFSGSVDVGMSLTASAISASSGITGGTVGATGNMTAGGNLGVAGAASVGSNLDVAGKISSTTAEIKIGSDDYIPWQFTYLDNNGVAQTMTVLKKR